MDEGKIDAALPASRRWPAIWSGILGLLLLGAVALRVLGLSGDFWFDEVWSARYSLEATSLAAIYQKALDNNHFLNSAFIHLVGARGSVVPYRALAFFSGLVALALATFDARPRTPLATAVRALLIGGSPLIVLLSSEARGYAPALACCGVAGWALRRTLRRRDRRLDALFNIVLPLGLLSHLVFAHFYLASFAYAVHRLYASRETLAAGRLRLLQLFAIPAAAAALHAWAFVSHMETGGGPSYAPGEFASRLVGFGFGIPEWPPLLAAISAWAAWAFAVRLRELRRARDSEWVFLLVIVVLSPLFFLTAFPPKVIAVRYFVVQIFFLLIAISERIAAGLERGGARRVVTALALAALLCGNAMDQVQFARYGRGGYRAALEQIARHTAADRTITIGGDHDSRVRLLVEFQQRFIGREFRYVRQEDIAATPPDWFVVHDTHARPGPPGHRISVHGHLYRHVARFPFAYLSGFTWDVYRLERRADA